MSFEKQVIRDCTLYRGDCLEVLPTLGKVDAVVTDPPYGIDWDTDYTRFTTGFDVERTHHRPIANDATPFDPSPFMSFKTVVMFGANCFSDRLPKGSWYVWDKRFANGKAFLADGEAAWCNRGHGIYIKSVTQQGFVRPEKRVHPTQKPVDIMAWVIERTTKPGETILDPFCGSGTTGVACVKLDRRFIGIELEPKYFDIACRRIEKAYADQAIFDLAEPVARYEQPSLLEPSC